MWCRSSSRMTRGPYAAANSRRTCRQGVGARPVDQGGNHSCNLQGAAELKAGKRWTWGLQSSLKLQGRYSCQPPKASSKAPGTG